MPGAWRIVESVATPEGALELRERRGAFLIQIGGRVLMNSLARRSEEALSELGLAHVSGPAPRVLVGGLGMAYTLRAALDRLPPGAQVEVAELNPVVEAWCRGPLAPLTKGAALDPRVRVWSGDVARRIAEAAPGSWDAILLDLYEGPHAASQGRDDPFYGPAALSRSHRALAPGGALAIWAERPDVGFERRLTSARFTVTTHTLAGGSGWNHVVYVGRRG